MATHWNAHTSFCVRCFWIVLDAHLKCEPIIEWIQTHTHRQVQAHALTSCYETMIHLRFPDHHSSTSNQTNEHIIILSFRFSCDSAICIREIVGRMIILLVANRSTFAMASFQKSLYLKLLHLVFISNCHFAQLTSIDAHFLQIHSLSFASIIFSVDTDKKERLFT